MESLEAKEQVLPDGIETENTNDELVELNYIQETKLKDALQLDAILNEVNQGDPDSALDPGLQTRTGLRTQKIGKQSNLAEFVKNKIEIKHSEIRKNSEDREAEVIKQNLERNKQEQLELRMQKELKARKQKRMVRKTWKID
mmetsp:Transcript_57931/g.125940  ORF Transcript_57931/g.125940 Transcript_57931/m.125940 type:complete len:142 (-) Transcript_57931:1977-2402(-)